MRYRYLLAFIALTACSLKINAQKPSYQFFDCKDQNLSNQKTEGVVILKANDLRSCFIEGNDKIVWISSYWQRCSTQDIIKQKNFYSKYQEKLDFIIISETFDISEIKNAEEQINHPIFFIDPTYNKARLKNSFAYLKDVLGENATSEALKHTSIFIKNGIVIKVAYDSDLTDEFFRTLL